jgi:hypothetical protein
MHRTFPRCLRPQTDLRRQPSADIDHNHPPAGRPVDGPEDVNHATLNPPPTASPQATAPPYPQVREPYAHAEQFRQTIQAENNQFINGTGPRVS